MYHFEPWQAYVHPRTKRDFMAVEERERDDELVVEWADTGRREVKCLSVMRGIFERAEMEAAFPAIAAERARAKHAVPRYEEGIAPGWADHWSDPESRPDWLYDGFYYRVEGFLAVKCQSIGLHAPQHSRSRFEDDYKEMTGEQFDWDSPGVSEKSAGANKWHRSLEIRFRASDEERRTVDRLSRNFNVYSKQGLAVVSHNALLFEFLHDGFRFVKGPQDVAVIRSHVLEKYWVDFDAGAAGRL